jgi:hypothetical protein
MLLLYCFSVRRKIHQLVIFEELKWNDTSHIPEFFMDEIPKVGSIRIDSN